MKISRDFIPATVNSYEEYHNRGEANTNCFLDSTFNVFGLKLCGKTKKIQKKNAMSLIYEMALQQTDKTIRGYKISSSWKNPG